MGILGSHNLAAILVALRLRLRVALGADSPEEVFW